MYLAECQPDKIVVSPSRKSVERLEAYLLQGAEVEIPTEHKFAPGIYIREITIPAGALLTGAPCKFEHLSVMVRGKMRTLIDGVMQDIEGYHQWIAPAGVKRVGVALEETVWFCVYPNPEDETSLDILEDFIFEQAEMLQRRRAADGQIEFTKEPSWLALS